MAPHRRTHRGFLSPPPLEPPKKHGQENVALGISWYTRSLHKFLTKTPLH